MHSKAKGVPTTMLILKYSAALLLIVGVPSMAYADIAGRVNFVAGQATILDEKNNKRSVFKGDLIHGGEKIETASNARAQLRLTDGSVFVLLPNSLFEINQYRFNKSTPETGKAVFNLVKGGLRAITGSIAKANPEHYVLNTPNATLSIRSTDYSAALSDNTLVVMVSEGKINLANTFGATDIERGQTFEVQKNKAPMPSKKILAIASLEDEDSANTPTNNQSLATPSRNQRPRLENFASYNEFIQAVYLYKKAQEELSKPKIIINNLPNGQISPEYTLMDNNKEVINWGEDITRIMTQNDNSSTNEQTSGININMSALNPSEMGGSSVDDALGGDSFSVADVLEMEDTELSLLLNIDKYDDFDDKRKNSELLKRLLRQSIKTTAVGNDIHIIGIEMNQPEITVINRFD